MCVINVIAELKNLTFAVSWLYVYPKHLLLHLRDQMIGMLLLAIINADWVEFISGDGSRILI